jgi:hypothetical protein
MVNPGSAGGSKASKVSSRSPNPSAPSTGRSNWASTSSTPPRSTAYINEELVGRAIKGRRDEVVLATKFGMISRPDISPLSSNTPPLVSRRQCSITQPGPAETSRKLRCRFSANISLLSLETWCVHQTKSASTHDVGGAAGCR